MGSNPAVPSPSTRVVTIPNVLSLLRLLAVPVFLWLLLGPHADVAALVLLALSGISDWADGVLARRLNQTSRLGTVLDPAVDRLFILATLVGLSVRHVIPWWLAALIIGRDLVLAPTVPLLRRRGLPLLPVHYLGKAATFSLLYAFPFLLFADRGGAVGEVFSPIAWAFTIWGTALYLWAGALYLIHFRRLIRAS